MKNFILTVSITILLTGCVSPLSQTPDAEIKQMSLSDICDAGSSNDELALAEKIANARNMSCDAAKNLCFEAGLNTNSSGWASCFIQAKGVIAQQETARAAKAAAVQAMNANLQKSMQAVNPVNCYTIGSSTSCY